MDQNTDLQLASDRLANDVQAWLATSPGKDDIEEYAKRIGIASAAPVLAVTASMTDALWARKSRYFKDGRLQEILLKVDEFTQLDIIRGLCLYEPASVISSLAAAGSSLDMPHDFPKDISVWATEYCADWDRLMRLATAFDYIDYRLYAESFLTLPIDDAWLVGVQQSLTEVFKEEGLNFQTDAYLSDTEKGKMRSALSQLRFLPEEYIEKVIQRPAEAERFHLVKGLIRVVTQLRQIGPDTAKANPGGLEEQLWYQLILGLEDEVLTSFETKRRSAVGPDEYVGQVLDFLEGLWVPANIDSGLAASRMRDFVPTVPAEQRRKVTLILETFLENSLEFALAINPLDAAHAVVRIQHTTDMRDLEDYFSQVFSEISDPERKGRAMKFVALAFQSFQGLRGAGFSTDYTRQ